MPERIEAVIFDLDDTLYDCTGQLTDPARRRAARCLVESLPNLDEQALCRWQARLAESLGSGGAIREIARQHGLPAAVIERVLRAYNRPEVEAIVPFPDVPETLAELRRRGYRLSIVTTGRPDRQRRKIRTLGLAPTFQEKKGTLVIHDDRQIPLKDRALQKAAARLRLAPERILSVGDKLNAEIAASNRLGMRTARLRHGRQKNRRPDTPEEIPHHEIDRISDLLRLLL